MGNKIKMTKGDTLRLHIDLYNDDGSEYEMSDDDELVLTVKPDVASSSYVIQKTGQDVVIEPSDTSDLKCGVYVYDAQMTFGGGDVWTVIKPTLFEITPEVTTTVGG